MKDITFHLPELFEEIVITGKPTKGYMDPDKSAEELDVILSQQLPPSMYSKIEERIVIPLLRETCDLLTLQQLRAEIVTGKSPYSKILYKYLNQIIKEKEQGASRDVSGNE
jgi:hypothetical protein